MLNPRKAHHCHIAYITSYMPLEPDLPYMTTHHLRSHIKKRRARRGTRTEAEEEGYE